MDGATNLLATRILKEHGRHPVLDNLFDLEPESAKIPLIIRRLVSLWRVNHGSSGDLKELVVGISQPWAMMREEDKDATSTALQCLLAGLEHRSVLRVVEEEIRENDGVEQFSGCGC